MIAVTPVSPATSTGVGLFSNGPPVTSPQQYTVPAPVSAQVEAIAVTPDRPTTGTGVALFVVVPSPSWLRLFGPQQDTVPSAASAHE